jgi:diadenosine tetraphosphate (Ap4A) HIT family hydrolase
MMHATLQKFGYPATLVKELEHWCIVMRPAQATLGALVLIAKSEATSIAALPAPAYAELHTATRAIESGLNTFRPFNKINYLALMMVDPHVHFHVLPRYAEPQMFDGTAFPDPGWPALPDLKFATPHSPETAQKLHKALVDAFATAV